MLMVEQRSPSPGKRASIEPALTARPKAETRTKASFQDTKQAALAAARLSSNFHVSKEEQRPVPIIAPVPKQSPYLAAASKAWLNSNRAKSKETDYVVPKLELNPQLRNRNSTDTLRSHKSQKSDTKFPVELKSRSSSQHSETIIEVQSPTIESGRVPLAAARKSYEAHRATEMLPPSRPNSTRPLTSAPFAEKRYSQSTSNLQVPHKHHNEQKNSIEVNNRSALAAASIIWANHDLDHPKPSTPQIDDYHYIVHKPQITLRKIHKETVGKFLKHGRVQPIPTNDRKRYEGLWAANKGILLSPSMQDEVCNLVVKDIWQRSRLQPEILADIYNLVDRERLGRLERDEFVVGTWLVDHCLLGRKLPLKADLPDEIFDRGPLARLGVSLPKALRRDEKKLFKKRK